MQCPSLVHNDPLRTFTYKMTSNDNVKSKIQIVIKCTNSLSQKAKVKTYEQVYSDAKLTQILFIYLFFIYVFIYFVFLLSLDLQDTSNSWHRPLGFPHTYVLLTAGIECKGDSA